MNRDPLKIKFTTGFYFLKTFYKGLLYIVADCKKIQIEDNLLVIGTKFNFNIFSFRRWRWSFSINGNISLFRVFVDIFLFLLLTSIAVETALKIRCLVKDETKTIGMSLKGI